ncbi:hypothetical protein O7623_13195 [Solwaraspora sp. WMMD791]|uniref:hypothetical protein n=1 Tax=Solwaraspora sp. WMMD791 TaxID=3016086 RepID=UPI00249CF275|nr:hypothetical protein [Solwaraspora sp. WMMD791]WFE30075.1 hypothetical protein O7623_13195 [Solwaraspora sp. WMMD791]
MTTYLSADARKALAAAQTLLDLHVPSVNDGRCLECGEEGPCPVRRAALRVFGRYRRLPRRRPGATFPELIGERLGSWSGWWRGSSRPGTPNG